VHQSGGAERVIGVLATEGVVGNGAELLVDRGEQAVHDIALTAADFQQVVGDGLLGGGGIFGQVRHPLPRR
jgi:hypothetical protein